MEAVQWAETCRRYESLWRTARLSEETINAWFDEFGVWADYALAMRALSRLSTDHDRPPSLATWREVHGVLVRERAADRRRDEGEPVPDGPGTASWARRQKLGAEWQLINDSLHDERLHAMHAALAGQVRRPGEPTDAEAQLVREALVDEIKARAEAGEPIERIPRGDPRRPARAKRGGELTRIGEVFGGPADEPRPSAAPRAAQAVHRYCRNGSKCVISVAGHGAALSRMFDTGDLCLRCWQKQHS
jgi:hypothetical protein